MSSHSRISPQIGSARGALHDRVEQWQLAGLHLMADGMRTAAEINGRLFHVKQPRSDRPCLWDAQFPAELFRKAGCYGIYQRIDVETGYH